MKKNFKFIVAAIAAIAMVGCAKDGGEKIATPKDGIETVASFRITFPKGGTRAFDDGAAAPAETKINDAEIFIFDDATKTLESRTTMDVNDATSTATATVATFTGKHYVYVLVNTPATLVTDLNNLKVANPTAEPAVAGTPMATFLKLFIDAKGHLPKTPSDFMMTAYAEPTFIAPTIDIPNPTENKVNMGLGRAVAKVNMADGVAADKYPENMLKVDPLKYKVMNNPNTFRAFQQYSMTLNGLVIDNVGTIVNDVAKDGSDRDLYHRIPDDVAATNYTASSSAAQAGVYVPENWNTNPAPHTHNATSLIVQGKVFWKDGMEIRKANGMATTVGSADYTAGSTFYRVWDKQAQRWLDYIFCGIPGEDDESLAMLVGAAGQSSTVKGFISTMKFTMPDPLAAGKYEFYIAEYKDANAYWRLPLYNESLDSFVVARNDYFWVTITSIAELGASSDSDDPDKDGVLPKETTPLTKKEVDIEATVEVLKWNGIEQEGHI